jgi:hypothetical protein
MNSLNAIVNSVGTFDALDRGQRMAVLTHVRALEHLLGLR